MCNIYVCGVHEGRYQADQTVSGLYYDIYACGRSELGQYGSQVWVRRSLGYVVTAVRAVSARVMIIVLRIPKKFKSKICVISAHAPHSGSTASEAQAFWTDLAASVHGAR